MKNKIIILIIKIKVFKNGKKMMKKRR